ncbi:MAG: sensor histidine kinase, partial [Deltaproteobacteria bacterium]
MVSFLKNRTLKEHLTFTWLISSGLAVLTCALSVSLMGWVDYRNTKTRLQDELVTKSTLVSRRIAAEMLLGIHGATEKVAQQLEQELGLNHVSILPSASCPHTEGPSAFCSQTSKGNLWVTVAIPHLQKASYVTMASPLPPFFTKERFSLFFLSVIPIALVLGFAIGFQRYFVNKHLLHPIASLVDTSTGAKETDASWPKEIQEISKSLSHTFEEREQAIYGQMTRGIIHDIRTLLHSVLSAVQLVKEQPEGSTTRQARLETLFKATHTNLPKINTLIDLTLDAGRDISIKPETINLSKTLSQSITTVQALSLAHSVSITTHNMPDTVLLSHDPIQLERVFTNLIKNGLEACLENKAQTQKGTVSISGEIDPKNQFITVVIEDSGKGLSKEPKNVFRLLKSTKVHGSGLGLLVSKKIVQAHGGELIASRSKQLGGARFEVRLP